MKLAYENFRQKIVDLQGDLAQLNVEFLDRDDFKKFADNLVSNLGSWNNICITGYFSETIRKSLEILLRRSQYNMRLICPYLDPRTARDRKNLQALNKLAKAGAEIKINDRLHARFLVAYNPEPHEREFVKYWGLLLIGSFDFNTECIGRERYDAGIKTRHPDLDSERRIITLNEPEKGSNPRAWKVSSELVGMLNNLPKKSDRIFGDGPLNSLKTTFLKARRRLSSKLNNPRLLRISFHTFRHWKATTLYHKTKDPYYVKEFLGHKSIKSTEIYITIERTIFEPTNDEYTVRVATKPEEIKGFLETGFEYICEKNELVFLRKRK